jgi:hypothetical protein
MVIYICEDCNKKFDDKYEYTRHINRKTSCVRDENKQFVCNTCKKILSSYFSLKRHERDICLKKKNIELLSKNIKEMQDKIELLNTGKSSIKNIQKINNNTINNNIQQNINNYFSMDTLPLGKEDTSHLTDKGIINMLRLMNIEDIHSNLIEIINFNKNKINNENLIRYNRKYYLLLEYDSKTKKFILNTNSLEDLTEKYIMRNIDLMEDRIGLMIENKNPEIIAIEKTINKYNEDTDNLIYFYNYKNKKNTEMNEKIKKIKDKVEKLIITNEVNKMMNMNTEPKLIENN